MSALDYTVLLPVWRGDTPEAFAAAAASLAEAVQPPNQVLVCEDGPLPETLARVVAGAAAAPRWRRVRRDGPGGLHHNLNHAARHVETPWIARMDADDLCLPDRFDLQLAFLRGSPDIDVLGGAILEFAPDGRQSRRLVPLAHEAIVRRARWRNPMNHMTVMLRLDRFFEVGGYPDLPRKEDYGLWLRLIRAGARFANLPQDLVRVRLGADFAARRSGLANVASEWALMRLKQAAPQLRGPAAAAAFALRAGGLAFEAPADLLYRRVLR